MGFDVFCDTHLRLSDPSFWASARFLSCRLFEDSPLALVQPLLRGLEFLRSPSQLHRLHTAWFAALIALAHRDPERSRSFMAASSGLLPKSWLYACLPSTPCLSLSSLIYKLPSLWPPMSIPGPPANGHLPVPLVNADTVVCNINRHVPHPPGAQKSPGPLRPSSSPCSWPPSTFPQGPLARTGHRSAPLHTGKA